MLEISSVGFWVAQILVKFEAFGSSTDESILEKSTVLFEAFNRKEAIKKAIEYAHHLDDVETTTTIPTVDDGQPCQPAQQLIADHFQIQSF